MIPGIRWSPAIQWSPAIRWSIRSMDFDIRKVYGDTSITDGLVFSQTLSYWTITAPTWGSRGALFGGQFLLVGGYAPAAKSYQDSILAWNPVLQVTFILSFVLFSCPLQSWNLTGSLSDARYYHAVANVPQYHLDNICPSKTAIWNMVHYIQGYYEN